MKIIQIISDTNIGGAGVYLLSFLAHYDRSKFDMEVFLPSGSKLETEIKKLGVSCTHVKHMADKSLDMQAIRELRSLFKQKKPDLIHTHASMSARVAARLASPSKIKIVYTRHSVFDPSKKMTIFPLKQINGTINNLFSDKIIAVSPAAKINLTQVGVSAKKIDVIFNGVAKRKALSDSEIAGLKKKYGISQDKFIVALIARLTEVKGHEYVIDCAEDIWQRDKEIVFIFAGTGPDEERLKAKIKALDLKNIIMTGFIKEIEEIENTMDLQINASYGTEATSLSLLEGMSLKKPAVVSDFGGNPYVIEEGVNGLVVPKKDASALADAILKIKSDKPLRDSLGEGAAEIYLERFTVKKMVSQICDLYESLGNCN